MKVSEIKEALNLQFFGSERGLDREVTGGYTGDLMSDVMGHAQGGSVWITLQNHSNVIAIASLRDLPAVVLVNGLQPEPGLLQHAIEEGIAILATDETAFSISGKMYNLLGK